MKSSKCESAHCVEVVLDNDEQVVVIDTDGNEAVYTMEEWEAFIVGVKNGDFDPDKLRTERDNG